MKTAKQQNIHLLDFLATLSKVTGLAQAEVHRNPSMLTCVLQIKDKEQLVPLFIKGFKFLSLVDDAKTLEEVR